MVRTGTIRAAFPAKLTKPPLRGLGDVIERVTSAIGIKPCNGCKQRQAALNKAIPFKKK